MTGPARLNDGPKGAHEALTGLVTGARGLNDVAAGAFVGALTSPRGAEGRGNLHAGPTSEWRGRSPTSTDALINCRTERRLAKRAGLPGLDVDMAHADGGPPPGLALDCSKCTIGFRRESCARSRNALACRRPCPGSCSAVARTHGGWLGSRRKRVLRAWRGEVDLAVPAPGLLRPGISSGLRPAASPR